MTFIVSTDSVVPAETIAIRWRASTKRKIALYPDYNYSDTKWKVIEMYSIDGFENIEVNNEFRIEGIE